MENNIHKSAYTKANKMLEKDNSISITDFAIDELKLLLLTTDGIGKRMKVKVLEELIKKVLEELINRKEEVKE